jgi:hypothetical protein
MMRIPRRVLVAVPVILLASAAAAHGQQPAAGQNAAGQPARPEVLLKCDVTLARFQGDKKTSSLPFTAWVNVPSNGREWGSSNIRVGVDVPVGTRTTTTARTASGTNTTTTGTDATTEFRNVGTSLDCRTQQLPDGRFMVGISMQDSAIFTGESGGRLAIRTANPAAFRTFSLSNTLPMRDGQTLEFAAATDKLTGEVLKLSVTITVVK